jgi:cell division protein FtsI (penicillin-binding protein 3)
MAGSSRGSRPPRRPLSVQRGRPAAKRRGANSRLRLLVGRVLLIGALVLAGGKLVQVQGFQAEALSRQAEQQRATPVEIPAERGAILDRNGNQLAFSVEARSLAVLPQKAREDWAARLEAEPGIGSHEDHLEELAAFVHLTLGDEVRGQKTDARTILDTISRDTSYVKVVDDVDPVKAAAIVEEFPEVISEYRAVRVYPNGSLASNIIGAANWREDQTPASIGGLTGLENSENNVLAGRSGKKIVDTVQGDDVVIPGPGREREVAAAVPGKSIELTIDVDTQHELQKMVTDYTAKSGAKNGSAVVLDTSTGEIVAMANDKVYDPADIGSAKPEDLRNAAVTDVFEPGSVNKIITAAAAIENGYYEPDTELQVPGSIRVADRVVRDAWPHDTTTMTFTGVFAKSSNVGTLMAAEKVGEDAYADVLAKFGLGVRTGSGLPGEESGFVPPRNQWSGSTFGNLPIGQGLSMTLLQMAGIYQAIANDGVRVPPSIVRAEIDDDGTRTEAKRQDGVRVVSPETATTVREMFRAVVQDAPGQSGTGKAAALPGYQIAGKTGTAQQIDETCGCYSNSEYWITFAGILPADDPRFVVAVVLDAPTGTQYSSSAAPLFHDIASYLTQRYQIPMSAEQSPVVTLTR